MRVGLRPPLYLVGIFTQRRIRQCVGEQNYKWFVSFLLMHSIFCLYLSVIGALSIYDYVVTNKLLTSQFRYGNQLINSTPLIVFQVDFD